MHDDDRGRHGGGPRDRERACGDGTVLPGADRCRESRASVVRSSRSRRSARTRSCASSAAASTRACPVSSSCSRRRVVCCRARCRSVSRLRVSSRSCSTRSVRARAHSRRWSRATSSPSSVRSATAFVSTSPRPVLVGGGIGVAPLPYLVGGARASACRARLPLRAPRGSGSVGSERRSRDRPRVRDGGAA